MFVWWVINARSISNPDQLYSGCQSFRELLIFLELWKAISFWRHLLQNFIYVLPLPKPLCTIADLQGLSESCIWIILNPIYCLFCFNKRLCLSPITSSSNWLKLATAITLTMVLAIYCGEFLFLEFMQNWVRYVNASILMSWCWIKL